MKSERKRKRHRHPGWDDELWELRFAELKEYREEHGHTRVPAKWRGNPSLGNWVAHQRKLCRRGLIEPDRARRLETLGLELEIDEPRVEEHDRKMERMLARLAAYRRRYVHAGVAKSRDRALAGWIESQRSYRKEGTLKDYRRERLDAAGFPWEPVDYRWEEAFARLRQFKARFGHTRVPAQFKKDRPLGTWVALQRKQHRLGVLSAGRRSRLEELGFELEIEEPRADENDRHMERMLARLEDYRTRYGHAGVVKSRDRALAMWMHHQRLSRSRGTLKDYRRERMDAAGFPWELVKSGWEEAFARLKKFKARFGHTQVPCSWKEDESLGAWVEHQRRQRRLGRLSAERGRRLEEIGFAWEVPRKGGPA